MQYYLKAQTCVGPTCLLLSGYRRIFGCFTTAKA
jgi:hypothetical protein